MKKEASIRAALPEMKRVVIKIGSRVLIQRNGRPDVRRIRALVEEIAALHHAGKDVIVVSSGAIGAGLHALGISKRPDALPDLQMAAAVGQTHLMSRYSALFAREKCQIGQVLLSHGDLQDRVRHLNARNTLMNLLRHRIIPIINENDVVAVDEIKFGDNDHLATLVAMLLDADLLVLLSTVDGFRRPTSARRTQRVPYLISISEDVLALAIGKGSLYSIGGMRAKLEAAHDFVSLGRCVVIANGRKQRVIGRIMEGQDEGTLIGDLSPRGDARSRKRWIAYYHKAQGTIEVDEGAAQAITKRGKSLLPAGVRQVEGAFTLGSVINIRGPDGQIFARGLTEYSSDDIRRIMGRKTSEIATLLGQKDYDEIIHRDHLLVLRKDTGFMAPAAR